MNNNIFPAQVFNKYSTEIVIHEFVPQYGWSESCTAGSTTEAKDLIKDYKAAGIMTKTSRRKVLNKDAFLCQALLKYCKSYYGTHKAFPESVQVTKSNGVVKYSLSTKEIIEILGYDTRLVTGNN